MSIFSSITTHLSRGTTFGHHVRASGAMLMTPRCLVRGSTYGLKTGRRLYTISAYHGPRTTTINLHGRTNGPRATFYKPLIRPKPWTMMKRDLASTAVMLAGSSHHNSAHLRPHPSPSRSMTDLSFWQSSSSWKRASVNTLRCLIGCTAGDFSMMWFLQSTHPALGVGITMGASSEYQSFP